MISPDLVGSLRRSLLIKVLSKTAPTRVEVASTLGLVASKLLKALDAQSMTCYVVNKNVLSFQQVYFSPSLWADDPAKEEHFKNKAANLLAMKIPMQNESMEETIESGYPTFFDQSVSELPSTKSMASGTDFEIHSTLTVPLKTTVKLGAIQILNKEMSAGTQGNFTDDDLALVQEVADYASVLLHRMMDPAFAPNAEDTARFIARLTEHPLVTRIQDLEIDEKLVLTTGEAVIRREGVFPCQRIGKNAFAVVMTNPMDHFRREMFTRTTGLTIDAVRVVSSTVFEKLLTQYFRRPKAADRPAWNIDRDEIEKVVNKADQLSRSNDSNSTDHENVDLASIIELTNLQNRLLRWWLQKPSQALSNDFARPRAPRHSRPGQAQPPPPGRRRHDRS
ncbi:MAG TPA: GAF domain-containing protein [Opitutus sp.]|nr:GAF domain-containing protein [Opitutus sp.]